MSRKKTLTPAEIATLKRWMDQSEISDEMIIGQWDDYVYQHRGRGMYL
jgi:hypothetical protein